MSLDDLLTQTELSDITGIPEKTLERWRYLREGPPYLKVGRRVYYSRALVDDWLTEQVIAHA